MSSFIQRFINIFMPDSSKSQFFPDKGNPIQSHHDKNDQETKIEKAATTVIVPQAAALSSATKSAKRPRATYEQPSKATIIQDGDMLIDQGYEITTDEDENLSSKVAKTSHHVSNIASSVIVSQKNTSDYEENQFLEEENTKHKAAIKIQNVFRKYLRFNKKIESMSLLDQSLFNHTVQYVQSTSIWEDVPRAVNGQTTVYLPKELPIVLKLSGSPQNRIRFEKMMDARKVCVKNKYTSLVIPTARVHGDFIIETRLPIKENHLLEQMALYLEHWGKFTKPIKEFAGLQFQTTFPDLTGPLYGYFQSLSEIPLGSRIGRFDNVPLYLEDDEGKIGLVDLEHFSLNSKSSLKYSIVEKCSVLIILFPYHLDTILEVAKHFDPNIEQKSEIFEKEKIQSLKFFENTYGRYLHYLKEKGIDLDNPDKFPLISEDRKNELTDKLAGFYLSLAGLYFGLDDAVEFVDTTDSLSSFKKVFPEILDLIHSRIAELLKSNIAAQSKKMDISSYARLMDARTIVVMPKEMRRNEGLGKDAELQKQIAAKLDMFKFGDDYRKKDFIIDLVKIVLTEFSRREIAHYEPEYKIISC